MPDHFQSESGLPAETPHGRSNGRTPDSVRLGILSRREHRRRPGHHRPGCGGSTPPSCRVRVANFYSEVPALNRRERGAIPRQPTIFNAPVAQSPERDASNVVVAGESPAGSAILCRVGPNSRGAPLRPERLKVRILHAVPFRPRSPKAETAHLKRAKCRCKSGRGHPRVAHLAEASRSNREGCRCESRHADQFWNVNRTSEPGLGANECVPSGKWRKSTAFRHFSLFRRDEYSC